MSILFLAIAMLSGSGDATPPPTRSIVVTGARIKIQKQALAACLARNCPPNEDIDATLALAESQLIDGQYHDARTTLLASLRRNKAEAKDYPVPVSDLYRANGKVAAELGLDTDYYNSTWGIYRTLKYGLPSDQVRHFSAMMEVAEMNYRTRGHERARLYYDKIAAEARKAGRPDIAALAELRSAIRHLPPNSSWQMAEINRIAGLQGTEVQAPVLEAKLALARMAFAKGDERKAEELQRELALHKIRRPILIYSPPYEVAMGTARGNDVESQMSRNLMTDPGGSRSSPTFTGRGAAIFATQRMAPVVDNMWLDVAFRVTPEGKVADMKVTRSRGDTYWAKPLLASIQARRYTPGDPSSASSYRLERYTYTSGFERRTDTHSRGRSPDTRVEFLDLSEQDGSLGAAQ